jgi:2-polyprenyl-3-methyl-5-hydroxy-6-metoxy-1,4-benzoquinol methylase
MARILDAFAYRLRWTRRALLCRYLNRFPRRRNVEERETLRLHRIQKAEFARILGSKSGSEEHRKSNGRAVAARLALLDRRYASGLEIGCENGWFGRLLVERGLAIRTLGVDLREEEMRGFSRPASALLAASAERLPLRSASFDLIVAFHVIEHLVHPARFRRELDRLATPSADVLLALPLGWDEDPCHRWHFMTARGWKGFLRRHYGLEFLRGGVHHFPEAEFLGLFRRRS